MKTGEDACTVAALASAVEELRPVVLGSVGASPVVAAIAGVVRGLLPPGRRVTIGLNIGDVDPRGDRAACFEVSDKSLAVGGDALAAVMTWLGGRAP